MSSFLSNSPVYRRALRGILVAAAATPAALAGGISVQIDEPVVRGDLVEFRMVFAGDQPGPEEYRHLETTWLHRLAEILHQLPSNSDFSTPFAMTLDWEVEVESGSDVRGWYLSRDEQTLFVRPALFGADAWEGGDELVLAVRVPLEQATRDAALVAETLRANHLARDAEGTESETETAPPFSPPPARPGAPPEMVVIPEGGAYLLRTPSIPGAEYRVERSSDLRTWEPVGKTLDGDGHLLQWIIPFGDGREGFYRIRVSGP